MNTGKLTQCRRGSWYPFDMWKTIFKIVHSQWKQYILRCYKGNDWWANCLFFATCQHLPQCHIILNYVPSFNIFYNKVRTFYDEVWSLYWGPNELYLEASVGNPVHCAWCCLCESAVPLVTMAIQWCVGAHASLVIAMVTVLMLMVESCVIVRRASVCRVLATPKVLTASAVDVDIMALHWSVTAKVSECSCVYGLAGWASSTADQRSVCVCVGLCVNNSGGASAVKESGHFKVRKSSIQVTRSLGVALQKSWWPFFSSHPQNTGHQRRWLQHCRYGDIFILCSHCYRSKAIARVEPRQWIFQSGHLTWHALV